MRMGAGRMLKDLFRFYLNYFLFLLLLLSLSLEFIARGFLFHIKINCLGVCEDFPREIAAFGE